jgi:hypothetical protein
LDREQPNHKEREVKKFVLLHYGFETPTPEIMKAWSTWFESVADRTVDNGGFSGGREVSASGTRDLPWGMESITGYTVIEAESLDERQRRSLETIPISRASASTRSGVSSAPD